MIKKDLLEAAAALKERKAKTAPKVPDVLVGSFPAQRAFVLDESPFQYVFCTRRAAKSYSAGLKAIKAAQRYPKCAVPIIGLVRKEVKGIFWTLILKAIDEKYGLKLKFNESDLTATLPNGSVIYLIGLDQDESQKRKVLGQKFPLVIIDEAQDFRTDLSELVFHVLKPAVSDYHGSICLLGTPGLLAKGLFFDVTTGKEPGWVKHEWTTFDNTTPSSADPKKTCAEEWADQIAQLRAMKPGIENTPFFRRNYLREWVIEEDALVYRYQIGRNDFRELPTYPKGDWHRVLGIDLGYTDASAFVVASYHDHDPILYIEAVHKQPEMDITKVATKIRHLSDRFAVDHLIIDGANKQAVEEMRKRHNLPLIAADKTGKSDFIELMNGDLLLGRVKLNPQTCAVLVDEYTSLIWDPKSAKRQEHPACDNHCTDAALYAWRFCYNYLSEIPTLPPVPGTPEWERQHVSQMEEAAIRRLQSRRREQDGTGDPDNWELGWQEWK